MTVTTTAVPALPGDRVGRRARRAPRGLALAAVVIGVLFTGPLAYVVVQNIQHGADLPTILWSEDTVRPLLRSLGLATAVSVTAAAIGTGLAWLVTRTDVHGRRFFAVLAPLPLVFPSFVGATALISGFATGGLLDDLVRPLGIRLPELAGFGGAWFVLTLFTYPYVYLPVAARLRHLSRSVEESARLLGRGPGSVFVTVVMPQISTAVSAGTLLVFLYTVSDFGAVQLLRYDTVTRAIFANQLADQATSFALALLLALVALVVVIAEQRLVRRHPPVTARSPGRGLQIGLGRWRIVATLVVGGFLSLALVGPVASLLQWVIVGARSERTTGATALDGAGLGQAVVNTVAVSAVAAVLTVLIVLPVAYLTSRYRSRIGSVASATVVAGFALPGIVIGLAFVFWVLNTNVLAGLYQTLPLLVLAYVIHFGAQSMRASSVAVTAVPARLEDAARTLGAGRLRRLLTVEAPIMAPGLLAAGGLVLLSTMKELPATLFLRPTGFDTLATRIWSSMENVGYAQAGLDSLVLLAVSAVLTWLLVIRATEALD